MLIQEIGRFGDNIEDMRPTDLTDAVPQNLRKGNVGIFWHVGDNNWVIRKANVLDNNNVAVEMGADYDMETNPDDLQLDYNFFHKDIWQAELRKKEYGWDNFTFDHFSRGRILFDIPRQKFIIFAPKRISSLQDTILFLARAFNIPINGFEVDGVIYKDKPDVSTLKVQANTILDR